MPDEKKAPKTRTPNMPCGHRMGQPSGARIVKGLRQVCHFLAAQASALRHIAAWMRLMAVISVFERFASMPAAPASLPWPGPECLCSPFFLAAWYLRQPLHRQSTGSAGLPHVTCLAARIF